MSQPQSHRITRRAILGAAAAVVAASVPAGFARASQDGGRTSDLRAIPGTDQKIPSIGLGTSRQFDVDLADSNATDELKQTLQAFLDAGGTVIDSSPMYGKSEQVIGALSGEMGNNDRLWIATKVWTPQGQDGPEEMRKSMKLLGRENGPIELMQVHNLVDVDEHLKTLRQWKEKGTFRFIGVTHSRPQSVEELVKYAEHKGAEKVDFIQLPYNVELRLAEERLLPACKANGVATLINVPFGSGRLFRDVRERPLPDHVKEYAESWAQAFLKFILAHEAVTCAIPGTSNPRHVADNCAAMRGALPDEQQRKRLIEDLGA